MTNGAARIEYAEISSIPGWLSREDYEMFRLILGSQVSEEPPGDLAELGVYKGKSAVVIGDHKCDDETFTVVDLFETGADTDPANGQENAREYPGLSRSLFERNYLAVHSSLPVVLTGPSASIADSASHGTHRFVHVDASHLYEHVREDIEVARALLRTEGVIVLDDYRSAHTPGVAAAAWSAVAHGLHPILLTGSKMYATWADPSRWTSKFAQWLPAYPFGHELQSIAGEPVHRIWTRPPTAARWMPPALIPLARRVRDRVSRGYSRSGLALDQGVSSQRI